MELDNNPFNQSESNVSPEQNQTDVQVINTSINSVSDLSSSYTISNDTSPDGDISADNTDDQNLNNTQEMTFSANQIQEISMDNNGNVTIKFISENGADSITIQDFAQFSDGVGCLALTDGTQINTQALYTELCNDMGVCTIEKPLAGDVLDIALEGDKSYDLKFDINDGQAVTRSENIGMGENMTLTFDDGAQITFQSAQDLIESALNGEQSAQSAGDTAQAKFLSAMDVIEGLITKMQKLEEQYAQNKGNDSSEAEIALASLEQDLASELANLEPASGDEAMPEMDVLESSFENTQSSTSLQPAEQRYAMLSRVGEDQEEQNDNTNNDDILIDDFAEQIANVEPAAGGSGSSSSGVSGGGFGFQSSFEAQGVIGIDDVGPIDPTQLQYGIEFNQDDVFVDDGEGGTQPSDPANDTPEIFTSARVLDETTGFDLSANGTLVFDFGGDGAGTITPNNVVTIGGSTPSGTIYSGGQEVLITQTSNGYIGQTATGQNVFTLTVDPTSGDFTYTQNEPFDHSDTANPDDEITINFGVQIADADGDTQSSNISIAIRDDAPIAIEPQTVMLDETNLSPDTAISGQINADFGNDGAGSFSANGDTPTGLTSNQQPVVTSFDPASNTYTGISGVQTIFTLSIASDGSYDFVLSGTLDHPDINNPDDALFLNFGVVATDFDGDSINGTLTIEIRDDAPVAHDDIAVFSTTENSVDGNVIDNDDLSQDQPNTVTQITFGGTGVDIPQTGTASIDGDFGTLEVRADGSYTYTLFDTSSDLNKDTSDEFEYTLTDADGDTSTATLSIKGLEPKLIVGENVDDITASNTDHHIGEDYGAIVGGAAPDILIGDVGGASADKNTQDYNFVFIVDVSGSMGNASDPNSKISLLKSAVNNILQDFGGYQNGQIKVHITPFAKDVKPSETFTVTDSDDLTGAIAFVNTLSGSGYTNYEAPLVDANTWLQSGDPLGGNAITTTYFFSDGNPNKFINPDGSIGYDPSGNIAMGEITGADGSNEVGLLHSLNDDVIAVGIDASDTVMARLDVIDIDGNAIRIDDPNDLDVALQQSNPISNLSAVGDDVIEGGEGNDIIFGDSVNTDILADNHGLSVNDGNGWDTFDRLENGESASDPTWARDDTTDYIRNNLEELSAESTNTNGIGREGGNDTIRGGAGDDTIFGQEGDDVIYGGDGDDILSGGSGADQFIMEALGRGVDVISDFDANEGDVLDFSALLSAYDPTQQAIDNFVFAREEAGGTIISIDSSGSGSADNAIDLVALEGIQNVNIEDLVSTGNINVF